MGKSDKKPGQQQEALPKGIEFVGMKYREDNFLGPVKYTYEVYSSETKKQATEFLKNKKVEKENYYIEVNVGDADNPEVIVGVDIQGTYEA